MQTSQVEKTVGLDLSRIVIIGRTWEEYLLIFNLSKADLLGGKVLHYPSGACSFTANYNGHDDYVYALRRTKQPCES